MHFPSNKKDTLSFDSLTIGASPVGLVSVVGAFDATMRRRSDVNTNYDVPFPFLEFKRCLHGHP